jgi:hypothetical protein
MRDAAREQDREHRDHHCESHIGLVPDALDKEGRDVGEAAGAAGEGDVLDSFQKPELEADAGDQQVVA